MIHANLFFSADSALSAVLPKLIEGQAIQLEDGTLAYVHNSAKSVYKSHYIINLSFTVLLLLQVMIQGGKSWKSNSRPGKSFEN